MTLNHSVFAQGPAELMNGCVSYLKQASDKIRNRYYMSHADLLLLYGEANK
jgi:hypothetical protein